MLPTSNVLGDYLARILHFNTRREDIIIYIIFGFNESNLERCVTDRGCTEQEMFDNNFHIESPDAQLALLVSYQRDVIRLQERWQQFFQGRA